jgi:L-amino acid N-acyltransferase YncA
MINYGAYRKFINLPNGKRIMFRCLNHQDREELIRLFKEAPEEDLRFLKQDVRDEKMVGSWVDNLNHQNILPVVAVNMEDNRIIADATLHRGKHAAKHIGEVRVFVSRPFRNLGLGSLLLEEIIGIAKKENLHWLKAEIIADHKKVIKAFRGQDFEVRATLEDYFIRKDGVTHDIILMLRPVLKRDEAEF